MITTKSRAILLIDGITPDKLNDSKYSDIIQDKVQAFKSIISEDIFQFATIIKTIRECQYPCYKRDVLLLVVNDLITKENILPVILSDETSIRDEPDSSVHILSNSITIIPDLFANCNCLKIYPSMKHERYFTYLLDELYPIICKANIHNINQKCDLFIQTIGKIALFDGGMLVWCKFTSRFFDEPDAEFRKRLKEVILQPFESDSLEVYTEQLFLPIFYYTKPDEYSGIRIKSLLDHVIAANTRLEYIICNKVLLLRNYNLEEKSQYTILFNIALYLSSLLNSDSNCDCLPIKVYLRLVESWSNRTKILLRTYEHNRYITYGLIIFTRCVMSRGEELLLKNLDRIQSDLMKGVQHYLDRASHDYRALALCIAGIVLPKLHDLRITKPDNYRDMEDNIEFDKQVSEDSILSDMKGLFHNEIEQILADKTVNPDQSSGDKRTNISSRVEPKDDQKNSDDDDLEIVTNLSDNRLASSNVPIYLSDCIDGLRDNDKPRYVRLCLLKATDLLDKISKDIIDNRLTSAFKQTNLSATNTSAQIVSSNPLNSSDSLRDSAIELAQVLLYLDDTYEIKNFAAMRISLLSKLCVSLPDLVSKFLLDEFNGERRNFRHQLEILQVITGSARELSGKNDEEISGEQQSRKKKTPANRSINGFVKFAPLYFYGIVDRLKVDFACSFGAVNSSTLLSLVKQSFSGASNKPIGSGSSSSIKIPGCGIGVSKQSREDMINRVVSGVAGAEKLLCDNLTSSFPINLPKTSVTKTQTATSSSNSTNLSNIDNDNDNNMRASGNGRRKPLVMLIDDDDHNNDTSSLMQNEPETIQVEDLLNENPQKLDNSYLLSRIFFSLAIIIECVNQQPIASRLTNDLLDYLAPYRSHPDSAVRKAIWACLCSIRNATPRVYFDEYISDKVLSLFGNWLQANKLIMTNDKLR